MQGKGFDAIILSAGATPQVARKFAEMLRDGGRLIVPIQHGSPSKIADGKCALALYARTGSSLQVSQQGLAVSFTPLTP